MKIAPARELHQIPPSADVLQSARRATYALDQVVSYAYGGVARNLHQKLVVLPPDRLGDQLRVADELTVGCAAPTRSRRLADRFGNTVLYVHAPHVDGRISFDVRAVVERGHLPVVRADRWSPRLSGPTLRTTPDVELRDHATDLRRRGGACDQHDLVGAIGAHVHGSMRYAKGVTDVTTTAAQAWSGRAGVCQDMAHVMVVLCRLNGIPARYVSGHLVGEGASHAWIEALVERRGRREVVAFDPTHDRRTDLRYLTVAVGRDYADVTPTSGTFEADAGSGVRGELTITKTLTITSVE
ncbi:MAG: transglutaminase-like domain-containing protein [Acidimicrobiales bacterium]